MKLLLPVRWWITGKKIFFVIWQYLFLMPKSCKKFQNKKKRAKSISIYKAT